MRVSDGKIQRAYRIRITIFLASVLLTVGVLSTVYQAIRTLDRLEVVERDRDKWQRPADILQALDLRQGNVVADIGSGAGYFTLKLSSVVGKGGTVLAVDIQRLPLIFLRIRALLHNQHNIRAVHGKPDDPKLARPVDAVLIVNAYHEFADPQRILECIVHSLRPGGRLVIADRGPRSNEGQTRESEARNHEMPPNLLESELLHSGFELVKREDRFVDPPEDRPWWLIVVRKPKESRPLR